MGPENMRDAVDELLEGWAQPKRGKRKGDAPIPKPQIEPEPEPISRAMRGDGPTLYSCGHFGWYTVKQHDEAKAKGLCCAGAERLGHVDWRVAGLIKPVPMNQRRVAGGKIGYQGLCCNAEGHYIGGIGNDCRYYYQGPDRCAEHEQPEEKSPRNRASHRRSEDGTIEEDGSRP